MKISENGNGQNVLVLYGGGGPATMASLSAHIAEYAHVITPTHPGWDGTPRPEAISNIASLADAYLRYLDERDLRDVVLVGSSSEAGSALRSSSAILHVVSPGS